jgi:hypothetical protein
VPLRAAGLAANLLYFKLLTINNPLPGYGTKGEKTKKIVGIVSRPVD